MSLKDESTPGSAPVLLAASKSGCTITLDHDCHPGTTAYLAINAPGTLVLFPKNGPSSAESEQAILGATAEVKATSFSEVATQPDQVMRSAFGRLQTRVRRSAWTESVEPYSLLLEEFRHLLEEPAVREDVRTYIAGNPALASAVEMLFTSIAMSARADWSIAPAAYRGVVARGWFLGRWIPTFLVLDGPIMRFLKSSAFRRQTRSANLLRAVRSFFDTPDFMKLRHAVAHWSFGWESGPTGSQITGIGLRPGQEITIALEEADAFHIIAFGAVEAIHEAFLQRGERHEH